MIGNVDEEREAEGTVSIEASGIERFTDGYALEEETEGVSGFFVDWLIAISDGSLFVE